MSHSNSASRLLDILNKGKSLDTKTPCKSAWKKVFDVQTESDMIRKLGIFMGLSAQIGKEVIDFYPNQRNPINHIQTNINNAIYKQDLNGTWVTFIGNIDRHTLDYLGIISDLLKHTDNSKSVDGKSIDEILNNLNKFYTKVIKSDIELVLKRYLLRKIHSLIESIQDYQLTGSIEVLDKVDSAIGHVFTNEEYKNFLTKSDLGKEFLKTLGQIADVITVVSGLPVLNQSIKLLLSET